MGNANFPVRLFPHRVRPCAAMNSPSHSGHGSRLSCPTGLITAGQAARLAIPVRSSTASSGSSIPAPHGVTSRNAMAPGRRSSKSSTGGGRHLGPDRHLAAGRTGRPRPDRPRPLVYRCLRHPGQPGGSRGEKEIRAADRDWAGQSRRQCKSRLTMRWGVPEVGSVRRSPWSATAAVSSSPSLSPPDQGMKAKRSSPR